MIWVLYTFLPDALMISATEYPKRLLRMCPKCKGLLVFGEEYSIITAFSFAEAVTKPNCSSD